MTRQLSNKIGVDLFYDVISPYCWISFEALVRYQRKFPKINLQLKPALLGAILKHNSKGPPSKLKSTYSALDLVRLTDYFDMPFNRPKNTHEVMQGKGSLLAQRLLTVIAKDHPLHLESLSQNLFMRVWSKNLDIATPESLIAACIAVGFSCKEAEFIIKRTKNDDIKSALRETTAEALNYGCFGLPMFVAHFDDGPKMFFGSDRLYLFTHYLHEEYPGPLCEFKSVLYCSK